MPLVLAKGLEPLVSGLRDQCIANFATQADRMSRNLTHITPVQDGENQHSIFTFTCSDIELSSYWWM